MKYLRPVFASLAIFVSIASGALQAHETYFETLSQMFEEGDTPQMENLIGDTMPGRCFSRKDPDHALAAVFYLQLNDSTDAGPLTKVSYEGISLILPKAKADYYDHKSKKSVLSSLSFLWSEIPLSPFWLEDGNMVEAITSAGYASQYRQSGKYLILKSFDISEENFPIKYCYYFKKKN